MTGGKIIYSVLLVLTKGRHLSLCQRRFANFSYPLSFSDIVWGHPFRIYGKALLALKLESSTQPMTKTW